MSKLYTITTKGYNQPKSFGAAGKYSWTSAKWVQYHLSRGYHYKMLSQYNVHTIDLATGTVTRCSAFAFVMSLPENIEKSRGEIYAKLGLPLDIATLDALHHKGAFVEGLALQVKEYLKSKGIE